MKRVVQFCFLITASWLFEPGWAHAHALGAECKIKAGKVEVEAYYDDDTAARQAKVLVLDLADKTITEGMTDDKGRWSFPVPQPGGYKVVVDAGVGHRTTVRLTIPGTATNKETSSGQAPPLISDGIPRTKFTRFPWLKTGLGLGFIAAFTLAFFLTRKARRPAQPLSSPNPGNPV